MALLGLGLMTSQSEDLDSAFPLLTSRLPWQQNYSIAHPKHPMSQPQTCLQTIRPSPSQISFLQVVKVYQKELFSREWFS